MGNVKLFMDSITVPNTAKVVKHVLDSVEDGFETYSAQALAQFILDMKPNSPKAIITICYVLGLYAKWLQDQGFRSGDTLSDSLQAIDKKDLWNRAKPNAKQKFITNAQCYRIISDIGLYEEFNELYYQTLFRCVYEGIYNDDMSVLKNLRGSEVDGQTVTLREDNGHTYTLKVSETLAADLVRLSEKRLWERKNRYGLCRIQMRGLYTDSVFKIEERKTSSPSTEDSYRFTFYAKLRKIADEYMDFRILPFQLYISGIMYRIILDLNKNGIPVTEAFADNSRNRQAHAIIANELSRCNYTSEIGNFREIVKGHLDSF